MAALERRTPFGPVTGHATGDAVCWKGIPYARPPVGALRWSAPLDPAPWAAARPADAFGPACIQSGRLYGPGRNNRYDRSIGACLGAVTGSEDCLYLNIWAPAGAAGPLPVIVFIHGGSNITGYPADPLYDGAALAVGAGAVVVTVGYRLGIFGFLHLPQLQADADPAGASGNFALLDIVQALRFVNRGIAAFGGDPGNVTLMGQSAGAVNVWALLTSPLLIEANPPLVHRALPISGGLAMAGDLAPGQLPLLQPVAHHERQGRTLLAAALARAGAVADSAADVARWLRAQSAADLLETVQAALAPLGLASSGPIPDGVVVARKPLAAIRAGDYLPVPLLAGYTRDEGKLFPALLAAVGGVPGRRLDDAAVFALQYDYRPDDPPQTALEAWIPAPLLPVDAPGTGFNHRMDQLNALLFHPNRDVALDTLRARQAATWCYRFDWDDAPAPFDAIYGAAHGFDIPFIFGNFGPSLYAAVSYTQANRDARQALSAAMIGRIGAFALHGDPNGGAPAPAWPAWPAMLVFDAGTAAAAISVAGPSTLESTP